jgi:hypothetical protein
MDQSKQCACVIHTWFTCFDFVTTISTTSTLPRQRQWNQLRHQPRTLADANSPSRTRYVQGLIIGPLCSKAHHRELIAADSPSRVRPSRTRRANPLHFVEYVRRTDYIIVFMDSPRLRARHCALAVIDLVCIDYIHGDPNCVYFVCKAKCSSTMNWFSFYLHRTRYSGAALCELTLQVIDSGSPRRV